LSFFRAWLVVKILSQNNLRLAHAKNPAIISVLTPIMQDLAWFVLSEEVRARVATAVADITAEARRRRICAVMRHAARTYA